MRTRRLHQVRAYVMAPYQLVKDLRTGVAREDLAAVLDGDIDCFLLASLRQGLGKAQPYDPAAPVAELD
jgi:protein subunit release factor B